VSNIAGVFDSALYRKLVVNDRIVWHGLSKKDKKKVRLGSFISFPKEKNYRFLSIKKYHWQQSGQGQQLWSGSVQLHGRQPSGSIDGLDEAVDCAMQLAAIKTKKKSQVISWPSFCILYFVLENNSIYVYIYTRIKNNRCQFFSKQLIWREREGRWYEQDELMSNCPSIYWLKRKVDLIMQFDHFLLFVLCQLLRLLIIYVLGLQSGERSDYIFFQKINYSSILSFFVHLIAWLKSKCMDVEVQQRNIFISFAVLASCGLFVGFMKTWKWFSRTGRIIIDLFVKKSLFHFLIVFFVLWIDNRQIDPIHCQCNSHCSSSDYHRSFTLVVDFLQSIE